MHYRDLEHPDITRVRRDGLPESEQPENVRCPICGKVCDTFYKTEGEIFGCEYCVEKVDAWDELDANEKKRNLQGGTNRGIKGRNIIERSGFSGAKGANGQRGHGFVYRTKGRTGKRGGGKWLILKMALQDT